MREIKFRAWSKEKEYFIAGFNMVNFHGYYNAGVEPEIFRYTSVWKLSEIELMQFIGAKDMNEKEMYEDDIFKWGNLTGRIIFDDGCFVFKCPGYGMTLRDHDAKEFEIIGNIYENPELLCQPEK